MNTLTPHSKRLAGFSLIEMAIVILIAGIMMGAGLSLLAVKQAAAQLEVTQKHQETIKQALINYLGQKKRLPCPADPATPIAGGDGRSATATLPPCISYSGVVPYAKLGLERSIALDGWENFIDYVVSPPPTTNWLYTYGTSASTIVTNIAASAFWSSNNAGSITANVNGTNINIVASLISHGKNGYGAVNIKGVKNDPSAAGTDEVQNINPILGTLPNTVIKRDTSDTPPGNAFDDIVMILSANDLTGPLIANGMLQSSSQVALSQANDVVLSNIVGSRDCTPNCASSTPYYYRVSGNPASPATPYFSYPPAVSAWGVTYAATTLTIDVSTTGSTTAYTLTAGDGSQKTVSKDELHGILLRGAGFN